MFFLDFRSAQEFGRAFFLLEKRPLVDFPIRKVRAREFVRARRGRGFFSTQRLQICADWVLSTQSSPAVCAFGGWSRPEDGRVRRMVASGEFSRQEFSRQEFGWARPGPGFRYTEIADSWRLDLSTHRLPIHWSLRGLNPWPWAHKTHALTN